MTPRPRIAASMALAALAALFLTTAGPAVRAAAVASPDRVLTATIPAAALTHLQLDALDGSVDLTADPNPRATAITVVVSLAPPRTRNFRRPVPADLALVALDSTTSANVVNLALRHAAVGNVEASWTITVPARFSARIDAHDGSVRVNGIEGGVEAAVNSGLSGQRADLLVDVPRGRLDLSVGVGRIRAARANPQFDRADVRATVGDARLFLLGHEIVAPRAPGPGHRVKLGGSGPEALSLRVSVGDVVLRIG